MKSICAVLSLGLSLGVHPASADTVTLFPTADTTLQEAFPNNNFGGGTSFTAGGRQQGGRTRALMLFNVAGSVPAGATINSVTLTLDVISVPSGPVSSMFDLNRLTVSWGEGTGSDHGGSAGGAGQATWNNRLGPGTPWATAGGDFDPAASGTQFIGGFGSYTFPSTAMLVSDVQGWLNNPAGNFGWLLRSESELTPGTIRRFAGREDIEDRPALTINYTPVPEPASPALAMLGLSLLAFFRRRASGR